MLVAAWSVDPGLEAKGDYLARRNGSGCSLPPPFAFAVTKLPRLGRTLSPGSPNGVHMRRICRCSTRYAIFVQLPIPGFPATLLLQNHSVATRVPRSSLIIVTSRSPAISFTLSFVGSLISRGMRCI